MARKTGRTIYTTEAGKVVHGMMAEYATPADFYHACEAVRNAGYTRWDSFSPFPVHGIDVAMGLRPTRLPLVVATLGFTGAGLGYLMQLWMTQVDYPLVVQGKPYEAWEPRVPITFELGILFTAFTCLIGMLAMNALPRLYHPLMKKERFLRVSDDRFVICVEAADPKFDPAQTRRLLESAHGTNVDLVEE
ncbi:MAG TPA: DUF3341 domain-containing protein [Phycisphaerales bacterium]|nr:DUF3341 domain-containing protein [Phycisphaerales bacterium]